MSSSSDLTDTGASKREVDAKNESRQPGKFPDWVIEASHRIKGCVDYALLQTAGEVSHYSSLLPHQISPASDILRRLGDLGGVIVDANAHVGCDTLNLARLYPKAKTIAVENDPLAFKCLVHNLQACKSSAMAVEADCVQYLKSGGLPNDITMVYFDPPWGGRDYIQQKKIDLLLSGRPVVDIINYTIEKVSPLVVLKAPANFDLDLFGKGLRGATMRVDPVKKQFGKNRGDVIYLLVILARASAS